MYVFIRHSLDMFGGTESAIVKTLGRPVSRTERKWRSQYVKDRYEYDRTLTYNGLVVKMFALEGDWEYVYCLSLTTDAYTVNGFKVGSAVADVERVLGPPTKIEGETLFYYTRSHGYSTNVYVSFKTKDKKVVEIVFYDWEE
jgi:hypothetical protein